MAAHVVPIVTLPNTDVAILDYLVVRTSNTLGARVDRADAIVVGTVQQVSSECDTQVARIQVERWLFGSEQPGEVRVVYPSAHGADGGTQPILIELQRGLLFLRGGPSSYHLAPGEMGMQTFKETDFDQRGQPFISDATREVDETIAAVEWYSSLSRGKVARDAALLNAIDSSNPRIARYAIRALSRPRQPARARLFAQRADAAPEDLALRFMLGLWLMLARDQALERLERLFHAHPRNAWLRGWGLEPTVTRPGQVADTLFGPDPSEKAGD